MTTPTSHTPTADHAAQHDEHRPRLTKARPAKARLSLALVLTVCSLVGVNASVANAAAVAPVAPPANAAATPDPARAPENVDPDAAQALAHQHHITVAEATERLARQQARGAQGARIEKSLGGRSGGIYLDSDGELVVTTLDAAGDGVATRGGARARRVDDSSARLDAITKQLDRQVAANGAGGVQGWYVDVPTNTVVVTVSEGAGDPSTVALTKRAESFGDSVRLEYRPADQAPQPAEWLVGGFEFLMSDNAHVCSVGFDTVDASNRNVVLTAGHCVTSGNLSRNGYVIGAARTTNYPGDDFGTFWNSYPGYWQPSPSIYKYNGTYARVVGQWDNPPVGATVCKSGRTTGFTCGTITGLNQTVTYTGGKVLYGLVRHNACVEGGDSGGSNISAGNYALGVTSGASTPTSGAYAGKCLSKSGSANVSWYQPVGEALTRNGLRLVL